MVHLPRALLLGTLSADRSLAYAVYFDYKRRNDPEFRKALKRESRRQARIAKEEAEIQGKQQREEIKSAVQEAIDEGFPTDIEEKEAFFMQQIAQGEALAGDGTFTMVHFVQLALTYFRIGPYRCGFVLLQGLEGLSRTLLVDRYLR